jgi:DNA-directed RNA polymerase subunit RPC12/RpoP
MGITSMLDRARDVETAYLCVLCGNIFASHEYHWGGRRESDGEAPRNWSCPFCVGVVVEYAHAANGR